MSIKGRAIVAIVSILAIVIGARVVSLRLADQWAATDPERALAWVSTHRGALLVLAMRQLEAGQFDQAEASARRLLRAAPLEGRAFRVLAEVSKARGDASGADRLYRIAVRRAPRDFASRAAVLASDLNRQHWPGVAEHADMMLRVSPARSAPLLPMLVQAAELEPMRRALLERVAEHTPWRTSLVREATRQAATPGGRLMLEGVAARGLVLPKERGLWVDQLIAQKQWGEAYARWASHLPEGAALTPVYNADFRFEPTGHGFDWRLRTPAGVSAEWQPQGEDGQMRLVFHGRRVGHTGLEQTLLLPPGRFEMRAGMRATRLRSERGLEWAVGCIGASRALGTTPPFQGGPTTQPSQAVFEVPAECPAQWLRLRNVESAPALQVLDGELTVDEVRIFPITASLP